MKKFYFFTIAIIFTFIFISSGSAQPNSVTKKNSDVNKDFDAEMAKITGANEYGNKRYILINVRKNDSLNSTEVEERLKDYLKDFPIKSKYIKLFVELGYDYEMLQNEAIAVSSIVLSDPGNLLHMLIVEENSVEKAQKILGKNPLIKSGVLKLEYNNISASAALSLVPKEHKKIVKVVSPPRNNN